MISIYADITSDERDATTTCEQGCGQPATVYAMDRLPGGWGGRYCEPCAKALDFQITDRLYKVQS